jgi:hypothetical protein
MYYFIDFEDHYSQNDSLVKFRLNDGISVPTIAKSFRKKLALLSIYLTNTEGL